MLNKLLPMIPISNQKLNQTQKFSKRLNHIRDTTLMLDMFHQMRQIYLFQPLTLSISDGKPILANSKRTMLITETTATQLTLLRPPLTQMLITKLKKSFSRLTMPSLVLGKKPKSTNHMPLLMRSLTQNYQRTLTGETLREQISQTLIETKDTVDLATLCLLLRSLR